MGYGSGAMMRGIYEGYADSGREIERQEDRALTRKRQGMQDELLEGQVGDARQSRTRRQTLENDPELQDPALDMVGYMEVKAKKARELGDQKTYEEMIGKVEEYKTKNYRRDFDRSMGRFLGTRGADPKALADFTRKYWNADTVIQRNDDGSFDVTMRPVQAKGAQPADGSAPEDAEGVEGAETPSGVAGQPQGETHRFKNIDELGMFAMQVANPDKYAEHLAKLREKDADQKGRVALERVKGEESRKTEEVKGAQRRQTNKEKPAGRGVPGGGERVPAAVKVLKAKEDTFRRLNPKATDEEVAAHLFPSRNTIGARDRLKLYQDIKKISNDPDSMTDEQVRAAAAAAERFAKGDGGPAPSPTPKPGRKPLESFQK